MSRGGVTEHTRFQNKESTLFVDPCTAETKASMQCLDDNNYDRSKCEEYFKQYRDCKKRWFEERRRLKREGKI
ncbi:uncharacterized protein VTP21DRAFT_11117 [Calcarisporiella thermophila]|uniref:uncharacterized protein n=1 Tax=Calcarisporiella thermophila TaxID=911321 RepID=UPI0037437058